jgi:hypothetical protein
MSWRAPSTPTRTYVLKNVIHDWPDDDAVRIHGNVRRAAATGKTLLLVEGVLPGHDREFSGNWVDLEMLVTADARERTAAEYGELFHRAGFDMTRVVETASPLSVVEATPVRPKFSGRTGIRRGNPWSFCPWQ